MQFQTAEPLGKKPIYNPDKIPGNKISLAK
jgi:hypothetical protein